MKNNSSFTLSKSLLNLGSLVILMVSCIPPAKAQLFLMQGAIQSFDTNSRCVETVRKALIKKGFDRDAKRNDEGNASTWSVEISTGGRIIIVCAEKTAAMGAINLDPNADSSVMDTYQLLKNTLLDEASQAQAPIPLPPPVRVPSIPPLPPLPPPAPSPSSSRSPSPSP